jgi:hypothetical protein
VSFACVAPLLLGFFGWDADRWMFLSIFSSVSCSGGAALPAVGGYLIYFDKITPRPLLPLSRPLAFFTQDLPQLTQIPPL